MKPLRTTDALLSGIFFINSALIIIKYGQNAVGQILLNICLGLIMMTMFFTSVRPNDIPAQDRTLHYLTRAFLGILIIIAVFILITEALDGVKKILGI